MQFSWWTLLSKTESFFNYTLNSQQIGSFFWNFPKITLFVIRLSLVKYICFLSWNIDNRSCEQNDSLNNLFGSLFFGNAAFLNRKIENWVLNFYPLVTSRVQKGKLDQIVWKFTIISIKPLFSIQTNKVFLAHESEKLYAENYDVFSGNPVSICTRCPVKKLLFFGA